MSNTSQAIDFQKYNFDKDVNARIKENRDDMLHILRADIKELDAKVEAEIANVKADIKALDAKVDRNNEVLIAKVDADIKDVRADVKVLDAKIDGVHVSIKQGKTLNKWIFGMLVTLLLGLGGLAAAVLL